MQELASSRSRHCLLDILAHYFFGGFSFPWRGCCCHRLQRRRRLEGRRHLCLLPMSVFLLQQVGECGLAHDAVFYALHLFTEVL